MPRTARKYKHNNTIKYTWGIHSITRKRMKSLTKPRKHSKNGKNKSKQKKGKRNKNKKQR